MTLAPARERAVAVVAVASWMCGAALSRRIGIWSGIGVAALLVFGAVVVLEGRSVMARLHATAASVGLGAVGGLAMSVATTLLYPLARRLDPAVERQAAELYVAFRAAPGWKVALMLPLVIAAEEVVWRGVVQGAARRSLGQVPAVLASAGLYALAHAPTGSPLLTAVALACGVYWGALAAFTGSLAAPLLAHLIWDLAVLVVRPLVP